MSDVLAEICAVKRAHVARRKAELPLARLEACLPTEAPRGFARSLAAAAAAGRHALIAEIKKASPSKGLIRADFDPPRLALAYREGGATCLSVLTDTPYFQGRDEYLAAARTASGLPALRKDFMLDPWQVVESRALGADCILLIMACLGDAQAAELAAAAAELRMDVLVEVHDEAELDRALALPGTLLGVNNRNLKTLEVDLGEFGRLVELIPEGVVKVAESGVLVPDDAALVASQGADAILCGEALVRHGDPAAGVAAMIAAGSR